MAPSRTTGTLMQVAIPHTLSREETRRRLRANSHAIGDSIPGGMAQVKTAWPTEDRMTLAIQAMGQALNGYVDVEDSQVVLVVDLPPALGFIEPMIASAIRQSGQKLLAPPAAS
jgi:hypothetical protein